MKQENKKVLYIIMFMILLGMLSATFCYNLGKTNSFPEAMGESWGMTGFYICCMVMVLAAGWHDLKRKNKRIER